MKVYSRKEINNIIEDFGEVEDELKEIADSDFEVDLINQLGRLKDLVQMCLEVQAGLARIE